MDSLAETIRKQQERRSPIRVYRCDCEAPLYCDCCNTLCPTNDDFRTPTFHEGDEYHYHYCIPCADTWEEDSGRND
jgi:hypothetical protein